PDNYDRPFFQLRVSWGHLSPIGLKLVGLHLLAAGLRRLRANPSRRLRAKAENMLRKCSTMADNIGSTSRQWHVPRHGIDKTIAHSQGGYNRINEGSTV